jgi:ribosomal protein S27AE
MAYTCNLLAHQQLYIENQRNQTLIVLSSSSPNQQQSQATSFATGSWEQPPKLFQTTMGYVLEINSTKTKSYIQIQGNQLNTLHTSPSLANAPTILLEQVPDRQQSSADFKPFEPMKPMKMGNMEMNMNPMEMRMGNMEMRMGSTMSSDRKVKQFCPQCGQSVKESDRFCSACGHNLLD